MAIRTPLNIEAVNLDNERELDGFHEAWIDSCEDKFQEDFRKLRELGIVDAEGRQLKAFRQASGAAFAQIRRAKNLGFRALMDYVAAGPVEEHIRRVKNRAAVGGHSASQDLLRDIYHSSMKNLVLAFEENRHGSIDFLRIYDNSEEFGRPRIILSLIRGVPRNMAQKIPVWLEDALAPSAFKPARLRAAMRNRRLSQ